MRITGGAFAGDLGRSFCTDAREGVILSRTVLLGTAVAALLVAVRNCDSARVIAGKNLRPLTDTPFGNRSSASPADFVVGPS